MAHGHSGPDSGNAGRFAGLKRIHNPVQRMAYGLFCPSFAPDCVSVGRPGDHVDGSRRLVAGQVIAHLLVQRGCFGHQQCGHCEVWTGAWCKSGSLLIQMHLFSQISRRTQPHLQKRGRSTVGVHVNNHMHLGAPCTSA